ncbi:MAG: lactate utilization protein C [Aliihoeflea sp.]
MSGREAILGKVRRALGVDAEDGTRGDTVEKRLGRPPEGIIPARGQVADARRVKSFCAEAEAVHATVKKVKDHSAVPAAVAAYLRSKNLPAEIRMGADRRLAAMPWTKQKALTVRPGPSDGDDLTGVSHAYAGIAETGTVVLLSGTDNPTTINFLPEHHIVVVEAKDIVGNLETVISKVRRKYGRGEMPRTLNMITGPSRSGDIEQKLLLGAHGPRSLHLIVVEG